MTPEIDAIRKEWASQCGSCDYGLPYACTCPEGDPRPIVSILCDEIEQLRAALDDAREVVRRLVHMEREHLGTGPEGHLSERDLAPLLHALHSDPEETEPARPCSRCGGSGRANYAAGGAVYLNAIPCPECEERP